MNITKPIALSMLIVSALPSWAYRVEGTLIEQSTSEALPNASYRIFAAADTIHPIIHDVTNLEGAFSQPLSQAGQYIFKAQYIGKLDVTLPFEASGSEDIINLGSIELPDCDEMLQELVVTGKKPLVVSDGAKLTYNLDEDPQRDANSILEMLRKVPMVTVDAQDNIKVRGSSDFKIYVNGRPDEVYSGENGTKILKATPASTIQRIEVITDPGAKFDAEGTGGILNLVTERNRSLEGYNANLSASFNNSVVSGSGFLMTKLNKVTASISAQYTHTTFQPDILFNNVQEYFVDSGLKYVEEDASASSIFSNGGVNLNLSWEPDTLNLFAIKANYGHFGNHQDVNTTDRQLDANNNLMASYARTGQSRNSNDWLSAEASYQHTFRRQGHHLILSYAFDYSSGKGGLDFLYKDLNNISFTNPFSRQTLNDHNQTHTVQLDYSNPLNEHHLIETGAKTVFRRNRGHTYELVGENADNLQSQPEQDVNMLQYQDISAIYASYTGSYSKLSTRLGLRYEYTRMGIDFRYGEIPDFESHLSDLVPNASLTYSLSPYSNLRLAYMMRISRPSIDQCNPYQLNIFANQITMGNPDLKSEHSNQISLQYSSYLGAVSGQLEARYSNIGNAINSYSYLEDNIVYTTYGNIGRKQETSLSAYINYAITKGMNFNVYASMNYLDYDADKIGLKRNGWGGNFNFGYNATLPWKLKLSANGGFSLKDIKLQGNDTSWYYYTLSLSRSFLRNDALTFTLQGVSFLTPTLNLTQTSWTDSSLTTSKIQIKNWHVGLSVSLRLGSLKASVKDTGAKLKLDDASSTGAGGNALSGKTN